MSSPEDKGTSGVVTRFRTSVTGPDEIELEIYEHKDGFADQPQKFYLTRAEAGMLASWLEIEIYESDPNFDPDAGLGDAEAEAQYREQEANYNAGIADGLRTRL